MSDTDLLVESLGEMYDEVVKELDLEDAIAVNLGLQTYLRAALVGLQDDRDA